MDKIWSKIRNFGQKIVDSEQMKNRILDVFLVFLFISCINKFSLF